jgi:hypothetical protein
VTGEHIKERSGLRGYYARGTLSFMVFGGVPFSFILGVLLRGVWLFIELVR